MLGDAPFNFLALVVGQRRQELWPRGDTVPQIFGELDTLCRAELQEFRYHSILHVCVPFIEEKLSFQL
jgi:hypothetical protein